MVNPQGVSKGYGFVAFSTPEEANRAVNYFNLSNKLYLMAKVGWFNRFYLIAVK